MKGVIIGKRSKYIEGNISIFKGINSKFLKKGLPVLHGSKKIGFISSVRILDITVEIEVKIESKFRKLIHSGLWTSIPKSKGESK